MKKIKINGIEYYECMEYCYDDDVDIPIFWRIPCESFEGYVIKYGEKYRTVLFEALKWLDEQEPKWKLDTPINKTEYIQNIIERIAK